MTEAATITAADRAIIAATQGGMPLVPRPFEEIARQTGLDSATVMTRMREMQESGILRRIAAVPNHYALGLNHNGMSVWDVDDREIGRLGPQVGALAFVSHCYRRPRVEGQWPYNLFAMVHGESRAEVDVKVGQIEKLLGSARRSHDVLFSTRILKKTGFRLQA